MVLKKSLLILIVIVSILNSIDAQWYTRHCGVIPININNITNADFECMWERASKNVRTGKILALAGIMTTAVGLIWASEVTGFELYIPYAIMTAGIMTTTVGLPIWITGSSRQSKLRKTPHYNNPGFGTLNVAPSINRIHLNNSYSLGISATLSF